MKGYNKMFIKDTCSNISNKEQSTRISTVWTVSSRSW